MLVQPAGEGYLEPRRPHNGLKKCTYLCLEGLRIKLIYASIGPFPVLIKSMSRNWCRLSNFLSMQASMFSLCCTDVFRVCVLVQSWPQAISAGIISLHTLEWNAMRCNFDMKSIILILGRNVEHRSSVLWFDPTFWSYSAGGEGCTLERLECYLLRGWKSVKWVESCLRCSRPLRPTIPKGSFNFCTQYCV